MICVMCGRLGPDKYTEMENGGRVEFHSACAICFICDKPDSQNVTINPQTGGYLFIHENCAFTPDQMSKLLELQHGYHPE